MEKLILFVLCFLLVYLFYFITIIKRKNNLKKIKTSKQAMFFVQLYHVDMAKISNKVFVNTIAISNALIISITVVILDFIDNLILKLIIGICIIIPLILFIYYLASRYLKKKEVN